MKGRIGKAIIVLFAVFVLIQLVPYKVTNPKIRDEPKWSSPEVRALAVRACFDCHSNQTDLMVVERIAPVEWWLNSHVREARQKLNFSQWHTAAGTDADDAPEVLRKGEMPPANYTWLGLHGDARLTKAEIEQLAAGLEATITADPPTGREGDEGEGTSREGNDDDSGPGGGDHGGGNGSSGKGSDGGG